MKKAKSPETDPFDWEELLRKAMRKSGKSLNVIATEADVSSGQLSRFLRGERTLTLPVASKVGRVLGLTLSEYK